MRYTEQEWGDSIVGTKAELQAFGLGVGLSFPGEAGGPRHELRVRDARGFAVSISRQWTGSEEYGARIKFPHWPGRPSAQWAPAFPGVKRRERRWGDEYLGSGDDLAAAGLVLVGQLPGQPGRRKVRVTIYADGTFYGELRPNSNSGRDACAAGARQIVRVSASTYRVEVRVLVEEEERRRAAEEIAESAWRHQVRTLPRPARLQPLPRARLIGFEAACASAARDVRFQGMLGRIIPFPLPGAAR